MREESSWSGAVSDSDQISSQLTTTTPTVTTTEVWQWKDKNKNNNNNNNNKKEDTTESWSNEEVEKGGPLPIEMKAPDGLSVPFPERPRQQEQEHEQRNGKNRLLCEDCT